MKLRTCHPRPRTRRRRRAAHGALRVGARSPIRVGVADQSPAMFANPCFRALNTKRTRYFVPADVMQDTAERAKARSFVLAGARGRRLDAAAHLDERPALKARPGRLDDGVQAQRRPDRRLLPRARRQGLRRLERGQPPDAGDVEPGRQRGLVLQVDVPRGQGPLPVVRGRRARRPRPGRRRQVHGELLPPPQLDVAQAPDDRRHPQLLRRQPQPLDRARRRSSARRASTTSARSSGSRRPARSRASAVRSRTARRARRRG